MTERDKLAAEDKKRCIYNSRAGVCEVCGKIIPYAEAQLAHRINKGKPNLKKYGPEIIHHPKNLALTCSDKFNRCNDASNIGNNPMKVEALVAEIKNELTI